ncbi:MAG: ATP-dependent Clp protease ATP-binding subunit [Spirochaetota bacterium]
MNNYTKRARAVLDEGVQTEGKRLKSDSVGPEHILLAILNERDCFAMSVLSTLGINFDVLRRNVEHSMRLSSAPGYYGPLPANSRFNRIVEIAKNEAKKLHSSFTGTEHLILALFRDGATRGIDGLSKAGIDYGVIFREVSRMMEDRKHSDLADHRDQKMPSSLISEYSADITSLAIENALDPVIGRDKELSRIIRILCRKTKNNPLLIGEAGVGKTAVIEGLAQRIVSKDVPDILRDKKILSLDIASIVAGTKYRGDFEDRMKKLLKEALAEKKYIIFIDEIHMIMGAGAAEGSIDAANILKPFLARGEMQCIGATTIREYKKHIEKDPALERRFQPVLVEEPTVEQSVEILSGIKSRYEEHHRVRYTDGAVRDAVVLSKRYIHDRYLPDKAIDLIDEAGAQALIDSENTPEEIRDIEKQIESLQEEKTGFVSSQEFEKAAAVRDRISGLRKQLSETQSRWKDRAGEFEIAVDGDCIRAALSQWTGIPVSYDDYEANRMLLSMEEALGKKIIGQDRAISVVSRAIRRSRSGIRSEGRPSGIFLFAGPTGVGKTECAKALAEFLFNDKDALIRFDMSEYMEKHAVARLIGSPPGYVGFEEGGQLIDRIKRKPFSVVLFDEIEKAHPDIYNILLQIFEEGEITDGMGRNASLRDSIIVLTSNAGNSRFDRTAAAGFARSQPDRSSKIHDEIRNSFNPELINRIDEIVVFSSLSGGHLEKIVNIQLSDLSSRVRLRGISLSFREDAVRYITGRADGEHCGARNIRRIIQCEIEDRIAQILLAGDIAGPFSVSVSLSGDARSLSVEPDMTKETDRANGITVS